MFEKGSEWRRWDLHAHTPGTILNNQFGTWDEYIATINAQDQVRVIGVTDYLTIRGYSELKKNRDAGKLPKIDLLLPNIEFRIAPPTDRATAINIHLVISPDEADHERQILNALARLHWKFNDQNYSCTLDQLTALGYAFDPKIRDDKPALEAGVLQFKVDFTTFRDWFANEPWLQRNALVAVSAGADGLSGFRRDGAWAAHRDEISRFSKVIFSGRPGEREFWLGIGTAEDRETMRRLHGPKPCVHGSDAHNIAKLFNPDQQRFCWVKADPTFEGLRQILYEPGERVFIGPTPPVFHDTARVITEIRLYRGNGWFDDVTIPLNPGLVSIIGQKGSGKSALAELTAYAAGSWSDEEAGSFLNRAHDHLDNMVIELLWGDGSESQAALWLGNNGENEVRYLSQNFVERLCAQDGIGTELVREIESVIFAYLDPSDTLNASDFEELRHIKTDGIRQEADRLRAEVTGVIQEECALRVNAQKLPEKRAKIKTLTEERDGLVKQIPPANTPEEQKLQQDMQQTRDALARLVSQAGQDKQKLQRIIDVRTKVGAFRAQSARFYTELEPLLKGIGIPDADLNAFKPAFPGDTEAPLAAAAATINAGLAQREGGEPPAANTIRWLQQKLQQLQARETADKAKQERTKQIQNRIAAINNELERLVAEIAHIEGPDKERIAVLMAERVSVYRSYFVNLQEEARTLESLYEPIRKQLNEQALLDDNPLEFSIRWEADLKSWLERASALFDQRRTIPYGTYEKLGDAARRILGSAFASGDPVRISAAFEEFMKEFRKPDLLWQNYVRTGITLRDVLEWLYEVQHIRLTYGLKFNGTDLESLSPGTKGIVLLILYLGMDIGDTRPLIVDQPDENLDNESIYKLLTPYFRRAKQRRQIIVITHNPNLVVNADSEQVIIATSTRRDNGLPHITYQSGSLENDVPKDDGIRHQVCRILEGGRDAFLKREQRYALPEH